MNNPIKISFKSEIIPMAMILISLIAAFYFYAHFPETVPTHWNIHGQADGYSSRAVGAFAIPIMLVVMYVFFLFLPTLDPNKERYSQFIKPYLVFKDLIIAVLAIIYFAASLNGLGYKVPIEYVTPVTIGFLFIVIGNYMGKIKRNWFVGIRTPWTISNEEVWNKSNRFGGYVFIVVGIVFMLMPLMPEYLQLPLFIISIAFAVLGTTAYSYILYLKENKKHDNDNQSPKS
jgi:uncharacterized membrane protein